MKKTAKRMNPELKAYNFTVDWDLHSEFQLVCEDRDAIPTKVMRRLMAEYVSEHSS